MKRWIFVFLVLGSALFFYHQYEYTGPYDAILRKENISKETVLDNLKRWRYHTDVWFEIVPDAITTFFKRFGIGGWTETGHRVCAEGCPYWTEDWTDGFYSIDLELEKLAFGKEEPINFSEPRYLDIEIWGKIRAELAKKNQIPVLGQRVKICGPLRVDRPYYVYTIQPDHADEIQVVGTCGAVPKENNFAARMIQENSCEAISSFDLYKQIALVDSLVDQTPSPELSASIEKALGCVNPKLLEGLSTDGEVYEKILALVPSIKDKLKPLQEVQNRREDRPVRNTISDLIQYWTDKKVEAE